MKQWPCIPENIKKLLLILINKQLPGEMVTEIIICQKAKALNDLIKMKNLAAEEKSFKANWGWLKNLKRTGICSTERQGEAASSDAKAAENLVY